MSGWRTMPSRVSQKCSKKRCQLSCCVVTALVGLMFSEGLLVQLCTSSISDSLVLNDGNLPTTPVEWESGTSGVIHLYNLTNGYELLRMSPPPKPIFEEVKIRVNLNISAFDFKVLNDGDAYSYKNFFYMDVVDKATYDLEFVNINVVLMEVLLNSPGIGRESMVEALAPFVPSMAGLNQAMQYDAYFIRPDGTGPLGAGIFKRLTVREMIYGYYDSLFKVNITQGLQKGRYNVFNTAEDLKSALNAFEPEYLYTDVRQTGKRDINDAGKIISLKGLSNFSKGFTEDPLSGMTAPAWDITGNWSSGTPELIFEGLRTWSQPLTPATSCPSSLGTMTAAVRPKAVSESFTIFDDRQGMYRKASFKCSNDCKGEKVHNALWVHKYELADENWKLKKDGIIDEHGFCLNTSSCDHAMRHPYIMEGSAKVDSTAFSLPYFGNVSEEIANATVTLDHLGKRPVYDRSTMGDKIWVDPLTGTSFKYRSDINRLTHVQKAFWDNSRHANIFGGTNPDSMYWPYYRYVFEIKRTKEDVNEIVNSLGTLYTVILWITTFSGGFLISKSCAALCFACSTAKRSIRAHMQKGKQGDIKITTSNDGEAPQVSEVAL